jgi:hypothetical protein
MDNKKVPVSPGSN